MSIKSFISKKLACYISKKEQKLKSQAIKSQEDTLQHLITTGKNTDFGKDHHFDQIKTYEDFKKQVPFGDYEIIKPYIEKVKQGKSDVLWTGKPTYFAKTSGTTSGAKYIPITKESMPTHIKSARNALLSYINESGNANFVSGKMIFLQGSPTLEQVNGIYFGRLSGIVAHHVPSYLQKNRLPSFETNCIDDWETKVDKIVDETIHEDMRLISGIPSWVQMYFEKLIAKSGKQNIKEIFPNFSLFVYGGVNFEPYRKRFEQLIGGHVDTIETYPASEGFIAYQDSQKEEGLLLQTNNGIFYEFIPTDEFHNENPTRISLKDIEIGKNYVLILNTTAGLWGYNIGDTVKFVSKNPYRIIVTGRIKHYTSAFGEHVIAEEVEKAMQIASEKYNAQIIEFTVAPQVNPNEGLPYHEWFIEFEQKPSDLEAFRTLIDSLMCSQNSYYKDNIDGKVLRTLKITEIKKGGFNEFMKSQGKLGGQNKIPRLGNDRKIADQLMKFGE